MKMAVLGSGTMAQAIVAPMKECDPSLEIATYSPSKTSAKILAKKTEGRVLSNLKNLNSFDLLFLGCLPFHLNDLSDQIGSGKLHSNQTIVSILAATPISVLQKKLGIPSVFRMMPNIPSLIGHGVNIIATSDGIIPKHKSYLVEILKAVSQIFIVDEHAIDPITPVSGSGPAFLFLWAKMLEGHLKEAGINAKMRRDIVIHTLLGSAKLMEQSNDSFDQLKEKVTSPQGITFEALEEFKRLNLESLFKRAMEKAQKRALELSSNSCI